MRFRYEFLGVKLSENQASMTDKQFEENSVYRILDAAINRAGEGIRVVEDYVRMVLSDAYLAKELKSLRHDLTTAVAFLDHSSRVAARDSVGDVGRTIQVDAEYQRGSGVGKVESIQGISGGMIQANLARTQQALRTIEEFSKTISVELAQNVEQLRYRTYTIEKAVVTTVVSLQNLAEARLYVLLDSGTAVGDSLNADRFRARVTELVGAGVDLIQLRDKQLTDRELVTAGRLIAGVTRGTKTRFIMNDRADLAVACQADGVHVGQDELAVPDVRRIVGAAKLIGVSTHSIQQARQAVLDGANYIGVGPVFESQTKSFDEFVGLELVGSVASEIQLPAFAIGGINTTNVRQVVDAGLSRVAVSSAVAHADSIADEVELFRQLLGSVDA